MKLFRSIMLTLALLFAVVAVSDVVQQPAKVEAVASNCSRAGQYYYDGTYAQIDCFFGYPGDAVRMTITCRYRLLGVMHTYNAYGGWAYWAYNDPNTSYPGAPGSTGWSTASCGNHSHDWASGDPYRDRIIHACPQLNNGSGAWSSAFCF